MAAKLDASVGRTGVNQRGDVILVQHLLAKDGYRLGKPDGICGKRTQFAIETFQRAFSKGPH